MKSTFLFVEELFEQGLKSIPDRWQSLDLTNERLDMMFTERYDNEDHLNMGFYDCFANQSGSKESPEGNK